MEIFEMTDRFNSEAQTDVREAQTEALEDQNSYFAFDSPKSETDDNT